MNSHMNTVRCKNCNAVFDVENGSDVAQCPYCGTKFNTDDLIEGNTAVRVEKIKSQAYVDVEKAKQQMEMEKLKIQTEKDQKTAFKKGLFNKFLIVSLIIFVIGVLLAFAIGRTISGIISLAQVLLVLFAWLVGSQHIKIKYQWIGIITTILAFVLVVPYWSYNPQSDTTIEYESFAWSDIVLGEMLPDPELESLKGTIFENSTKELDICIKNISDTQYAKYVEACKEKGFTLDADDNGSSYEAYNKDGYSLKLSHYTDSMDIEISPPMEMSAIKWPESDMVKLLPVPISNMGNIDIERSDCFAVYIGNTTLDDYKVYVEECLKKGFDVDYSKTDKSYYAYDEEGYYLSVSYEGRNIMKIDISAPLKEEITSAETTDAPETEAAVTTSSETQVMQTEAPETQSPITESQITSDVIRMEVKEAIDAYEAFVDQYIEFIKKYESASELEMIGMVTEYNEYLNKLIEFEDKMNSLNGDLNDAELIYYSEVMLRCTKKINEAAIML